MSNLLRTILSGGAAQVVITLDLETLTKSGNALVMSLSKRGVRIDAADARSVVLEVLTGIPGSAKKK